MKKDIPIMKVHHGTCDLCGSIKKLEFHHWIYRLPVEERDFITVCRICHELIHFKKKRLRK